MEREDFDYDPSNPKLRKGAALVLYGTLLEKGFAQVKDPSLLPPRCQEIVMEFPVRGSTKHIVRIYTSISPRHSFRAEGKDAIRVVALVRFVGRDGSTRQKFIGKTRRVNRTGTVWGIVDRTLERAREAYTIALDDFRGR